MKRTYDRSRKRLLPVLLIWMMMLIPFAAFADEYYDEYADDGYYEEEYYEEDYEDDYEEVSEDYYLPIQSNEIENWPQFRQLEAGSAIVMDLDSGEILFAKGIDEARYPASITKIMTALVVLEHVDNLDEEMTCGDEVFDLEDNASNVGLQPEEKLTVRQALYALMLESANDAGNSLAMHVAGSISGFAQMMNDKAAELGLTNTHFTNPHGLHNDDHYVCARDMALIARAAYANDIFRTITGTRESSMEETNIVEEPRYFVNHHKMLLPDSDYYQEWCTGGKTGFTSKAWSTLVTYGEKNGLRLVTVVMHELNMDKAYNDTRDLMNYGFDNFYKITAADDFLSPTFYDILKLNYPNTELPVYQSDLLRQKVVSQKTPGTALVPVGVTFSDLSTQEDPETDGGYIYTYSGQTVGSGAYSFTPFPAGITLAYQQPRDMETLLQSSAEQRRIREIEQTAQSALSSITSAVETTVTVTRDFVEGNRMTAVLIGAFILVVLLILIIILILRCTREARIARRRRQEDFELLRREDEIDRMSAVQIEEELRAAMQEEQRARERAQERLIQEQLAEQQLRETEALLEQIRSEHVEGEHK